MRHKLFTTLNTVIGIRKKAAGTKYEESHIEISCLTLPENSRFVIEFPGRKSQCCQRIFMWPGTEWMLHLGLR